jgi:hypothetical protein
MHGSQMIYATLFMILAASLPREGTPAIEYACDPPFTRLFTPPRPLLGRYEVCTTGASIEDLLDAEPGRPGAARRYGPIEALEALDAFGASGTYKRTSLAQLYGGTRVRVVHGWSESDGGFQSITLLSPYPDAALKTLLPGTLEIRWTLR